MLADRTDYLPGSAVLFFYSLILYHIQGTYQHETLDFTGFVPLFIQQKSRLLRRLFLYEYGNS
uniref:Uncharacterized protein n=1 Tax=Myoviridae sp. ct5xZ3 TaxID=2827601 RepID=A0A8S5RRN5_9CAUD|nr:MAG TPA: hypothetical protein [Myoviridae sp. ct5xZ3]